MLLVVLSPSYLNSQWCARERNAFMEDVLRKRAPSSIFIVEFEPVEPNQRPIELCRSLGYPFWDTKESRTRIFGLHDELEQEYYQLADDLVRDLKIELDKIGITIPEEPVSKPINASADVVFLAEVTPDLYFRRQEVRRYLMQAGFQVVPTCLPRTPKIFTEAALRDMRKSRLFVQLLGDELESYPDLPNGYARLQLQLAGELNVRIMQWRSPDLNLSEIDDPQLIELLTSEKVRAEGIEEFKAAVKRAMTEHSTPKSVTPSAQRLVYIDSDLADEALANEVRDLITSWGLGYVVPMRSPDPTDNRKDMEDNIINSDAILLCYGKTKVVWVRNRLRECNKNIRSSRESPLDVLAILEGPPIPKTPIGMGLPYMIEIDWNLKQEAVTKLKQLLQA